MATIYLLSFALAANLCGANAYLTAASLEERGEHIRARRRRFAFIAASTAVLTLAYVAGRLD
ncbi:hypothetical protein [Methylosinus sporium]|uniref:Uncharacterized protein n=1 Tax=Methylosinus sporium TaxID=428 RepID=A0A2U1SSP2_METSR|nr:hypothetical protein [Methylosinus sporium]PWB94625.1 hypothetical protein C5689_06065 [Methylosinus sporium]